ncbi:MAG TPA: hypothetical protein PLL75_03015 [Candidatus Omnitrophota bacterium]|nr:hypothetical protein [Candidatus Omnitrophota bacterium]HPS36684.1 hypothetical protein [Candidatus Omnitrophota bacterium]
MKSTLLIGILVALVLVCQGVAFAESAGKMVPVGEEEVVAVAEDAKTGGVEAVAEETDELYAPAATPAAIKTEAKEEIKDVNQAAKEAVKDIKAEEKEALKEAKM